MFAYLCTTKISRNFLVITHYLFNIITQLFFMEIAIRKMKSIWILIALCLFPVVAYAQSISVSGTVVDEIGDPIPGANVLQKGTTNGVLTDIDGNFSMKAPNGATLVVSYIGYETQEVKAAAKVNVVLREDNKMLEDVVVIGYGTQRREAVTGSVASVSAEKLNEMPSSNITYALQNRVAGVDMQQTNSKPGAEMRIRIRGQRSLSASNDPLIVLDGIPFLGSLSDINPSDIKSMDILKDASSTAIYGSRGANGVIMITTNKGSMGTPAKVSYNGYVGAKTLFSRIPMMDGDELGALRDYAGLYKDGVDEKRGNNTDWQDLLYRTGIVTSHDVNVSGGTSGGGYSFGAAYYHDESVVPTQDFDRLSLRANIDQKVGKYFRTGLSSTTSYNTNQGNQVGIYNAVVQSPLISLYDDQGNVRRTAHSAADDNFILTRDVVEQYGDLWVNETKNLGTYNTLFAEVEAPWVKGLKYRINLGLNYRSTKGGSFTGMGVNNYNASEPSSASLSHTEYLNWAVEHLLTYDNTFAEKHTINVVGMYSAEQTTYTRSSMSGREIPAEYFQYYNIGHAQNMKTIDPNGQSYWQAGLVSYMGRVMYTYDNKYMVSATVRSDASSRLAKGHQWHTYPAVSLGWNISKEEFMKDVEWVDNLKLRVGYGQTSNQSINPYSTLGSLGTQFYNFGSEYATGYYTSTLPNENLGWEYSETYNYGLDFTLFGGRLSGTAEYYVQKTNDILLNLGLPSTAGVSSYTANIGKTQNKGFELTLNGTIIENKNGWTWEAGFNASANRNKLVELASGQKRDEGNRWFVGYPIACLYDYVYDGLWNEGDKDYEYLQTLEPGGNAGMIKVKYNDDIYGADGKPTRSIGNDDRQIISLEPKFVGGFNTRVAYKNWDLNIIGAYQVGGKIFSTLYSSAGYLNMMNGRRGNVKIDYWTENNKNAHYPKPGGITSSDNPKYGSTLGLFDGSMCKIRTITLGYNFKGDWMKKSGLSALRLYGTVQNPFVISSAYYKQSKMDPETNGMSNDGGIMSVAMTGGTNAIPVVGYNSPATRNYMVGINVTF